VALETLRNVESVGGFDVKHVDYDEKGHIACDEGERTHGKRCFIEVHHKHSSINGIWFNIQDGPIKEVGVNGCQVDTLIETGKKIVEGFNSQIPCQENDTAVYHLDQALRCLGDRKRNRLARGVEGVSKL